ncbi:MAG: hypothetical protein EOM90_00900 [Alphaproteobacteria bacterium]|nr:hypothetical protein [Alphaproteobacteria bacterium]
MENGFALRVTVKVIFKLSFKFSLANYKFTKSKLKIMLSLKINGLPVDVSPDFSVTMNLKSPIFCEPGSYSYPFKIPGSQRNKVYFNFSHKVPSTSSPYKEYEGELTWNQITFFSGTVKLKILNENFYEGYLLNGNGDFNYRRKNSYLQDIDFGTLTFESELQRIDYINGCLGKFYPERNIVFPQILNKSYFEEEPTDPWHLYFNYYKTSIIAYATESYGRTVIVPMLYLKYVLKTLFEGLHYQLIDDFFSKDSDFNSLVLFNSVDCNTDIDGFFKYDPTKLFLNYHVPRMSINDFLSGLESFFNLRIFVNNNTRSIQLKSVDKIIKSSETTNFSDRIISVSTELEDPVTGFRIKMDVKTDDEVYQVRVEEQNTLIEHIKPSVKSLTDLNPWPSSNIFDTRWVEEKENYYILSSGKTWIPISGMYWGWNLFSEWIYKNSNVDLQTRFSTLMSENVHPYNAIIGNKREDWEDVSPKLFFARLQDDGSLGKRMSGRCFVADQYANVSNNLFYGGENGLLNKHYKTYFDFSISTKLIKVTKRMSFVELKDFDFSKKYFINGVTYLVKSIQVTLRRDRIEPAILECYKIS